MNQHMELRKATWTAALRLAVVVSAIAAIAAVTLSEAGEVPRGALRGAVVAAVMLIGFVASWVQTGHVARAHHEHRVAVTHSRRPEPGVVRSAHSTSRR